MTGLSHGDLTFDSTLLLARRNGEEIHFTRRERKLLALLVGNPRKLLTRARLAAAIAVGGQPPPERHIDIVVHRLRAKLGDDAREPRFIANQRGEGYVWIAAATRDAAPPFVLVGPCYGLVDPATAALALPFLEAFAVELQRLLPEARAVRLQASAGAPLAGARFRLEAGLHAEGGQLHAACVLREGTRQIGSFRVAVADAQLPFRAHTLAQDVRQSIWDTLVAPEPESHAPTDLPLELRMHEAGLLMGDGPDSWRACSDFVSRAAADGSDPAAAIMRGLALYAQLLQAGLGLSLSAWNQIEDEIEGLVVAALPSVRDRPLLAIAAAKLLLFIGRGHEDALEPLVEEVYARSTAFAAVFALRGQLLMRRGALAAAVAIYDKAIELAARGSEFHIYLLVMKCEALMAADDRPAVAAVRAEMFSLKPSTLPEIGLMSVDPDAGRLEPVLEAQLQGLNHADAQALAAYLHRMAARHFQQPRHRANVMRGLLAHLARRFDRTVIPPEVAAYCCFGEVAAQAGTHAPAGEAEPAPAC